MVTGFDSGRAGIVGSQLEVVNIARKIDSIWLVPELLPG